MTNHELIFVVGQFFYMVYATYRSMSTKILFVAFKSDF